MGRKKKVQGATGEAVKSEYNFWDTTHDGPFLECLLELTERGLINNGTCKNGVFKELQRMMATKVPGCGLKAKPTIQNMYKKLKHWYHSTVLMKNQSGFGWDAEKECVSAEKAVWDVFLEVCFLVSFVFMLCLWIGVVFLIDCLLPLYSWYVYGLVTIFCSKTQPAKPTKGASFPQFFDLAPVFANGRATGLGGFSGMCCCLDFSIISYFRLVITHIEAAGNDPEIISEGDDSGSEDDEGPPVPLAEMVNPAIEEEKHHK
ncbi:unnamed protein product [Linum tenue]|uniref:Myb/SANT-like domain-containing protein n=1 Tax=Linum tenue TaxID=586396 RepID=A0AAV0HHD0_9ROSI|nr:unnamed protein product [Linum tenue]